MLRLLGALLLATMGYTWTGTQIRTYDDADTTGGHVAGPHSALEMSLSSDVNVAANWTKYTANFAMYRGLATVLMGSSTGGTATTTWTDTNAVFNWDSGKTLQFVGSNNVLNWGTKVGSGTTAAGRQGVSAFFGASATLSQRNMIYGGSLTMAANASLVLAGDTSSEYIDVKCGLTGTTAALANFRIGTVGTPTGTIQGVTFWSTATGATSSVCSVFNPTTCERTTFGGNTPGAVLRLTTQTSLALKDPIFASAPSVADLVIATSFGTGVLVRPRWSGGTKISGSAGVPAGNLPEYWMFDPKVVDGSGAAVSGASVLLVDGIGDTLVNATTGTNGRVTYGSGITAQFVPVIDHVITGGVYSTRTRSPFTLTVNGIRENFIWPGEETGTYIDLAPIVPLQYATGNPTTWVERIVPS